MSSSIKTYTITEYGGFVRNGLPSSGYQILPEHTYDALENLILANRIESNTETSDLLSLSVRRGIGKIITARNYVGLITMKDGTSIEILPKIYGNNITEVETKRIFLEMLKTLKDVPFKDFNISNVKIDRLNLFEIFISMFITEAAILVKQGLKSSYKSVEANERFFKGKLNVSQNIKHNYVSRDRFFVRYDEWSVNRPENKLLKATLYYLHKQTKFDQNKLNISRLLSFFDGVNSSTDYEADFSKCIIDRSLSHYEKALSWCKVFLRGKSFTAFSGNESAVALLFPMERIFESYVAAKLRHHLPFDFEIRTQDKRHNLFEYPKKSFGLRPDIVIEKGEDIVIIDTKWKLLSENTHNYGISQSDMYQMYVYNKKYDAKKVILLYPQQDSINKSVISFQSESDKVEISFIDLLQPDISITNLVSNFRTNI